MNSEADPEHDRHDVGDNSCFVGMMHDAWGVETVGQTRGCGCLEALSKKKWRFYEPLTHSIARGNIRGPFPKHIGFPAKNNIKSYQVVASSPRL